MYQTPVSQCLQQKNRQGYDVTNFFKKKKPTEMIQNIIVCLILVISSVAVYFCNIYIHRKDIIHVEQMEYAWVPKAISNLLGYLTIILPGFLIYFYLKKTGYMKKNSGSAQTFSSFVIKFYKGDSDNITNCTETPKSNDKIRSCYQEGLLLVAYFVGLQISFGISNYLQEKIMTQQYGEERFGESQFLVFVNRIMAFGLSSLIICFTKQPKHTCPFYKYAISSTTNIFSSWTLYEALKYVNFPTQVLAKSCKPIPVMLMGKCISKTSYNTYEYFTTIVLSAGVLMFMVSTGKSHPKETTLSGFVLLLMFIVCDAFTTNWQGKLFKEYKMTPIQMMCGINAFSFVLTLISLLQQDNFSPSVKFMIRHPEFIAECLLLSGCSAIGQIFIYSIISTFGPLVFSIFSTMRQGLSILLSCLIFKHYISNIGIFGIVIVFLSIVLRTYIGYRKKFAKKELTNNNDIPELKIKNCS